MINVQDIRKNMVFKYENDLWTVMSMQHVQPGKGGAFIKLRARSQRTGNSKEMSFRSGEKIGLSGFGVGLSWASAIFQKV